MLDAVLGINSRCTFIANLVAKGVLGGNWTFTGHGWDGLAQTGSVQFRQVLTVN